MEREYKDFSSKLSEIHKMCNNEIEEIFKEHLKENGEVRICMGYDDEGNGIMMKDTYDPIIYHITSIGGKIEDDDVVITLYCNEDDESAIDWDLYECDDVQALLQVYDVVYGHFYDNDEDWSDDEEDYEEG